MKELLFNIYRKLSDTKKLPSDDVHLKQVKGKDGSIEFMAVNLAYKNFERRKAYPISLRLVFHKSDQFDEGIMSSIEFKLRNEMLSRGELLFIYRKEKDGCRELFFYVSKESLLILDTCSVLKSRGSFEDVEIILKCDKYWSVAKSHFNMETIEGPELEN